MQEPTSGPARDVLHRDEAVQRARRVRDVSYELQFELAEGQESYTGRATLEFGLDGDPEPLFLEFTGQPLSLSLNGEQLEAEHRGHRLWLPLEGLRSRNHLVLEYRNNFDATGDGFHHFLDPEDGLEYVYTNLEPYSAHRLFPCFDQPDIKGTYRLSVIAPAQWQVISADVHADPVVLRDGRRRHDFATTARFSTYLFSLIAGPYERIGTVHDGIPLAIHGRGSMRRELERAADELFEVTAQGLDYYRELFGQPYPFTKYDQLFVPEFNAGAMENVAAVTLHDSFIFRDPPTYGQRLLRGEVVLHELAHMWFGDLVTMRWWDDLWLNETFATYLSFRCLADATQFSDAWQAFNGQMRPAAYRQDQLVTTHPIAAAVENTDQAIGNFDAITYEKGAAVIKQLVAAIGDDAFRAGLAAYFERHAWSNATLGHFLGALGDAAGRSLDAWSRSWLQSPSLNTIGVRWSADPAGRIGAMELWQSAPQQHPTLRPHTTFVGLVVEPDGGGPLTVSSIPARIDGASQPVPAAVGRVAPSFVYPNHGDHDYALISLDQASLDFALARLPELPDPLLRQQTWSALWEMVRDARLRGPVFLDAVRRFAPYEQDRGLVQAIVDRATVTLHRYVPSDGIEAESAVLFAMAVDAMKTTPHQDLRLNWARAATAIASRAEDVALLLGLVERTWSIDGFEPDQHMRWDLAVKAAAHDLAGASERLAVEEARDRSDRGQRALIRAQVSRPDTDSKRAAWERIHGDGYGSDYLTRAAINGFQWVHQRDLLLPFRESFFERVESVHARSDYSFAESYVRRLVPDRWAEPDVLERIGMLRDELSGRSSLLRRQLDEVADDLERTIRVRAFASASE